MTTKKLPFWVLSGMSWDDYQKLKKEVEGPDGIVARYRQAVNDGEITGELWNLKLRSSDEAQATS